MSNRTLADNASRLQASLATQLGSYDGYLSMKENDNGWSATRYEDYRRGTESIFEHMKCIAATKDAVHLLDHAAKSLPDDMDVFDMTPEMPSGFLYLAEPLWSADEKIIVYLWAPIPNLEDQKLTVNLVVATLTTEGTFGLKNWEIRQDRTFQNIRQDLPGEDGERGKEGAIIDLRVVIAFNLLLAQGITNAEEVTPTRQLRRQMERKGARVDSVILVQLPIRHHAHNGKGTIPIDWSHRWIVSGHWRKQWYATSETHRPKWIAPHIKGPDDKPLVVKEKRYIFDPPTGNE